jgi:two-component system cell cycle response regulator CpdR
MNAPPHHARILLAEDDDAMRGLLARALTKRGYSVTGVADGKAAFEALEAALRGDTPQVLLLITDLQMPWRSGLELLTHLQEQGLQIPVLLISSFMTTATRTEAERLGVAGVFSKPFDLRELIARVQALVPPPAPCHRA